ncbi:MAG: hypothetical protein WC480_01320 [Patescibacteria group bacterium]
MDSLFIWKLILAFLVGGAGIALTTVAAERFGSKVGGFIGGLPSTSFLSFLFIGLAQGPLAAAEATTVFPLIQAIDVFFLVILGWLLNKGLKTALASSFFVWLVFAILTVLMQPHNFFLLIFLGLAIFVVAIFIFNKKFGYLTVGGEKIIYSPQQILGRAVFGGTIIFMAVLLSKIGGPVFGGIFSAFPAMFTSTMIISYRAKGINFARALVKPLTTTATVTCIIYGMGVRYFYPSLGLALGTIAAYSIAAASAWLTYKFLLNKI